MIPYLVTFIVLSVLSFSQYVKELKRYKLIFLLLTVLYLILFAGLRNIGVGEDDGNYIRTFLNILDYYDPINGVFTYSMVELNMEYGYVVINSLIRYITDSYTVLFLVISILSVTINAYNYNKYSKYVFLVLLLYFVHTYLYKDLNQIRAGLAAAILLFTIKPIHERKNLKTLVLVIIASLFHLSSVMVLLVLVFKHFLKSKKSILILMVISIIIGLFGIGHKVLNLLPNLGPLSTKLNFYLEYTQYNYSIGLLDITNIKNVFFLSLFLILWNRLESRVPYFQTLILFYAISVCFRLIFSDFAIIAGRLSSVLGIVEVILIPSLLVCFKNKILITSLIIIYAFVILYINLLTSPFGSGIYETSIFN